VEAGHSSGSKAKRLPRTGRTNTTKRNRLGSLKSIREGGEDEMSILWKQEGQDTKWLLRQIEDKNLHL